MKMTDPLRSEALATAAQIWEGRPCTAEDVIATADLFLGYLRAEPLEIVDEESPFASLNIVRSN